MRRLLAYLFFLAAAAPAIYALSLHDALPIFFLETVAQLRGHEVPIGDLSLSVILSKSPDAYAKSGRREEQYEVLLGARDRKSTRLNSSHSQISYAVFCLKKKKRGEQRHPMAG